jgi:hypothetical protein
MGRSHHPARSETASRLTSAALRRTHAPAFPDSDSSAAYARVQRIATAPRHAGKGRVVLAHALPFFAARLALALYRLRLFTTSPYRTDTPTARPPCGSSTTHGRSHRSQSGWSLLACAGSAIPIQQRRRQDTGTHTYDRHQPRTVCRIRTKWSCALPAVPSGLCDALGAITPAVLGCRCQRLHSQRPTV